MFIRKVFLFFWIIALNSINGIAQIYSYKNYTVKDGLPSSEVYCTFQDSKGYIWFGTNNGVSRFNGYEFENFSSQHGLPDNTIFGVSEDHKHRIWFRSFNGRLSYYLNDSIYQLPINDTLSKILSGSIVTSLYVNKDDTLFIGSKSGPGPLRYHLGDTGKIITHQLPEMYWYCLRIDSLGFVFGSNAKQEIATLSNEVKKGSNILVLIIDYFQKKQYKAPFNLANDFNEKISVAVAEIKPTKNSDYIILYMNKIVVFDMLKVKYKHTFETVLNNLLTDSSGNFWVSSYTMGVQKVSSQDSLHLLQSFLPKTPISTTIIDKEGGVWFSSLKKGVFYLGVTFYKNHTTETGLSSNSITIINADDRAVWLGLSDARINLFKNNRFEEIDLSKKLPIKGPIKDILFHSDGTVWISSTPGIAVLNNIHDKKIIIPLNKYIGAASNKLLENKEGSVWRGVSRLFEKVKRINNELQVEKQIFLKSRISTFTQDKNGVLWLACIDGLWKYEEGKDVIYVGNENQLFTKRFADLVCDNRNNIWMVSKDAGIIVKSGSKIISIQQRDGLKTNNCRSVFIDKNEDVWIGTIAGISKIKITDWDKWDYSIENYSEKDGMISAEINSIFIHHDTAWVATNDGVTTFNIHDLKIQKSPPPVYITGLQINFQDATIAEEYDLKYDQNSLTISFVGLSYKNAGNLSYRYRMIGVDTTWVYTTYRTIPFTTLNPGQYIFEVEAMNNDGVWSVKPAVVSFNISPPFWETWWFRILVILIISSFIYWRIHLIQKRERHKAEVSKQLTALELKSLKAQMNPHFLFNSLNALTDLTEEKSDEAPKFVTQLSKFYRYSLQNRDKEFVELSDEIKHIEGYIYMLKVRFGDSFHVSWNIDASCNELLIPSHSLQLLIENVTKHNIVSRSKPMIIEIFTSDTSSLIIKNKLQLKEAGVSSTKVGLTTLEQRYKLLTSKNILINTTNEYFSVELPLINPDDYESSNDRG